MITIDIDLLDDVYYQLSDNDKRLMVEWLKEDGFYPEIDNMLNHRFFNENGIMGQEFQESLQILTKNRHNLSVEEEKIVKIIADRIKFL